MQPVVRKAPSQRFTQQGWQQGRIEGAAAFLQRLLAHRFGSPLPAWAAECIHSARDEQLLLWGERVLDVGSLDEVFAARH